MILYWLMKFNIIGRYICIRCGTRTRTLPHCEVITEAVELLKQCDFYFEATKTQGIVEGDFHDRLAAFLRKVEEE